MALQSSGAISLAQVRNEFGGSNPTSLGEYRGAGIGIPSSGPISLSDFHGSTPWTHTITWGTANIGGSTYYGYMPGYAGSISTRNAEGYTVDWIGYAPAFNPNLTRVFILNKAPRPSSVKITTNYGKSVNLPYSGTSDDGSGVYRVSSDSDPLGIYAKRGQTIKAVIDIIL